MEDEKSVGNKIRVKGLTLNSMWPRADRHFLTKTYTTEDIGSFRRKPCSKQFLPMNT